MAFDVKAYQKAYRKKYYQENKQRLQEKHRQWTKDNPEKVREWARKRQAKFRKENPTKHRAIARRSNLNTKYGVSVELFDKMNSAQNGVCAVCCRPETKINPQTGKPSRLSVDHCHLTGRVRGLLCASCNLGLGNFEDSPDRLRSAALYLERSDG